MYVYGQLIRAAVELLSSDPSTSADKPTGRIIFNTAKQLFKIVNAAGKWLPIRTDETYSQTITQGAAAANLSGCTIDSAQYTSRRIGLEISRGTTLFFNQILTCQYVNSAWRVLEGSLDGEGDESDGTHGLTYSLTGTTTMQLKIAAVANAANTVVKWKFLESFDA